MDIETAERAATKLGETILSRKGYEIVDTGSGEFSRVVAIDDGTLVFVKVTVSGPGSDFPSSRPRRPARHADTLRRNRRRRGNRLQQGHRPPHHLDPRRSLAHTAPGFDPGASASQVSMHPVASRAWGIGVSHRTEGAQVICQRRPPPHLRVCIRKARSGDCRRSGHWRDDKEKTTLSASASIIPTGVEEDARRPLRQTCVSLTRGRRFTLYGMVATI